MEFMRTPIAHRCIGQWPLNRRAPLQTVRSISDADHNRTASCAPQTAWFADLGLSITLPIFIQQWNHNGSRGTSHFARDRHCRFAP
jgi:hypothetical protein